MNNLMKTTALTLIPQDAKGDMLSRITQYETWLSENEHEILNPDLAAYRDYLLKRLSPNSVSAHLSTIRARYKKLLLDRELFYSFVPDDLPFSERKAYVDEIIARLKNKIHPSLSEVKTTTEQDTEDSQHIRLTTDQATDLINQPGISNLKDLRDTCIIALLLTTGLREFEIINLEVDDLRQTINDVLSLRVKLGKGKKRRLIPYGELQWILVLIEYWLKKANISDGYIFRPFYKGNRKFRNGQMNVRDIQRILAKYPVVIKGEITIVRPHDCRRSYAKMLHNAGMNLVSIQQNLGHASYDTTLGYIGQVDIEKRKPQKLFSFDLSQLS